MTQTTPESDGPAAAATSTRPLVELRGVNKHFGTFQALADIDLTIPEGQVAIVIGP